MKQSLSQVLEYVKDLADKAHGEQLRKYTGERYIAHPVRVMDTVRNYQDDVCVLAAALLHDVLEDTAVTAVELEQELKEVLEDGQVKRIIHLVVELTDIYIYSAYPRMNRRGRKEKEAQRLASTSTEAQTIKYADIIDNVTDIVQQDSDFARVFVREAKRMLSGMDAGDPELRRKATSLVDRCLRSLQDPAKLV